MRILTGSLVQESNTFSPLTSDLSFFQAGCLLFGEDSLRGMAGTRTEMGGFIAASEQAGVTVLPTIAAWAASGGSFEQHAFGKLVGRLLRRVEEAGPIDGVLLALHGAWVGQDQPDADGYVLAQVRRIVGPGVPIVATLDLHANITARMVAAADALVGFRTYPHVDMFETGERAARLLFRLVKRQTRPVMGWCKVPMLVPPENAQTTDGPMAELMAAATRLEAVPGCLSASLFVVQPWLDVPELGCAAVVVRDDDRTNARQDAAHLGDDLWRRRHAFRVPLVAPDEAVRRAVSAPEGPILLVDSADSVSSGAPGDSTALLRALLDASSPRPAFATLVDPEAARRAAASDGAELDLCIGGRIDKARHRPVTLHCRARRVPGGRVTFSAGVGDGLSSDMGAAAVLMVGSLHILLMENPVPCYDPALYRAAGLEPAAAHIVVVKSPNNFRWTYRAAAREWIYVDAPGASTPRLETLPFTQAPRPLFPLDDLSWDAKTGAMSERHEGDADA